MQYRDPSKRARADRADCIVQFRVNDSKVAEPWIGFHYQHLRQFSKTSSLKQKLPRKFMSDLQKIFTQVQTAHTCQIRICDDYYSPIDMTRWVRRTFRSPKHLARALLAEANSILPGDFIPITIYPPGETDGFTGYRRALENMIFSIESFDGINREDIQIDAWIIGIGWRCFSYPADDGKAKEGLTVNEVLDLHDYYAHGHIDKCKKAVAKCFQLHGRPFEKGILDIIALQAGPEVIAVERRDLTTDPIDFSLASFLLYRRD